MFPFAEHPLAHCSATRIKSRVGFGTRSKFPTPKKIPPKPASNSSRFVHGDDHVAWETCSGRPSTPTASGESRAGSDRPAVAPVHVRHKLCVSQNPLTLWREAACQVTRPLAFSKVRSEYSRRVTSGAYSH